MENSFLENIFFLRDLIFFLYGFLFLFLTAAAASSFADTDLLVIRWFAKAQK